MKQLEKRWQRLARDVGLANATRRIMAENPGRGDSVRELDSIWEGMSVYEIYEAVLAQEEIPEAIGLWDHSETGANELDVLMPPSVEPTEVVSCNCL